MPLSSSPLQEAWQFLYPEEGPGGVQREVWHNPSTGEYQYRNESQIPGYTPPPEPGTYEGPRASTEELLNLRQLQEQRYPELPRIGESPPSLIPTPSLLQQTYERVQGGLGAAGEALGTTAQTYLEPFQLARQGYGGAYGVPEEAGPVSRFIQDIQQFPPILSTAAAAGEYLLGAGAKAAIGGLRASEAFQGLTRKLPELIFSEQGAVPFIKAESSGIPVFHGTTISGFDIPTPRGGRPAFVSTVREAAESVAGQGGAAGARMGGVRGGGVARTLELEIKPGVQIVDETPAISRAIRLLEEEQTLEGTVYREPDEARLLWMKKNNVSVMRTGNTFRSAEELRFGMPGEFRLSEHELAIADPSVLSVVTPKPQVSATTNALLNLVTEESGALRIPRWVLKKAEANTAKAWDVVGLPTPKNAAAVDLLPPSLRARWENSVRAVAEETMALRAKIKPEEIKSFEQGFLANLKNVLKEGEEVTAAWTKEFGGEKVPLIEGGKVKAPAPRAVPKEKATPTRLLNGIIRQELSKLPVQSTAEVDAASAWQRATSAWRGLLVTRLATAAWNFTSQVHRVGLDVIEEGIQKGIQELTKDITKAPVTADPMAALSALGNIVHFKKTREMLGPVFSSYPEQTKAAFRTYSSDILSAMDSTVSILKQNVPLDQKSVALVNAFNRAQEFIVRRAVISAGLEAKLQAKGLSLAELGRRIEASQSLNPLKMNLSEKDYEEVIGKALELTWATRPKYGSIADHFVKFIEKTPLTFLVPFPNFMVQALKYTVDYSPLGIARLFTPGEFANMTSGNFKNFSKGLVGASSLGGALLVRNSNLGGANWYDVKVPGTDKMVDLRYTGPTIAPYFLLADMIKRAHDGTMFNPDYTKDIARSVAGMQFPSGVGLELIDKAFKDLQGFGTGDSMKALERFAGTVVSGVFTPLQTLTDFYGAIHEDARIIRNTDMEPFFGPTKARLPGVQESLPPLYVPTRKGPLMTEEPLLKQLTGIRTTKPTVAEQELDRLQFSRQEILSNTGVPQWDALMSQYTGATVEATIPGLINSATYKAQDDQVKALILREFLTKIRAAVRDALKEAKPALYIELRIHELPNREKQLLGAQ